MMGNSEQGDGVTVQDPPTEAAADGGATGSAEGSPAGSVDSFLRDSEGSAFVDSDEVDSDDLEAGDASEAAAGAAESFDDSDADEASAAGKSAGGRSGRGSIRDLEEEGEVAADYLEEFLDIVDVDGDIDIDVENGRASLAIVAEGASDRSLRRLVGSSGEVLEALQELTRLAVQASTGERSRLMLDVAGHRAQRRQVLTERATKACEQVKDSGKPMSLDPMSAFERKIVHDVVAKAGLNSESEGVDPGRHVVILPATV